ncbi:hypothetical protein [Spirosoma arcticum]
MDISSVGISNTIRQGSAKRRIRLITNHYAEIQAGRKGLLTNEEVADIAQSFQEGKEMDLYNKAIEADKRTKHAILLLKQFSISYREAVANLTGYVLLWESYQRTEDLFNLLLNSVSMEEKERLKELLISQSHLLFATLGQTDDRERIRIFINQQKQPTPKEDHSLEAMLEIWKKHTIAVISKIKAMDKAIKEYMMEQDFKPAAYFEMIEDILATLVEDRATLPKYSKRQMRKAREEGMIPVNNQTGAGGLGATDQEKYFVFPDPFEVTLDINFYQQFKRDQLNYDLGI